MLSHHAAHRGSTLVEVLVALTLGAIVFGSASVSLLRQQQGNARARFVTDADQQLSASLAILANQIGSLHRNADLTNGELRDTALQARVPIAFTLACTSTGGALTLAHDTRVTPLTGLTSAPKPGDSLTWRADSGWRSALITAVAPASVPCVAPLGSLNSGWSIVIGMPDTIPIGSPIRVTRLTRYSIYRSSDGTWQLGFREATGIPAVFAAPQPVVGPLIARSANRRTGFLYFDADGVELASTSSGVSAASVARIRFRALTRRTMSATSADTIRTDSIEISLLRARGG